MIKNYAYTGNLLLQKTFRENHITKKKMKNNGEKPMVQREIVRRRKIGAKYSGNNILASKIICGECGAFYGSKVWHSTDKYRKIIWRCNDKFKEKKCATPTLDEERIKDGFVRAVNSLIENRDSVIADCVIMKEAVSDCSELNAELENCLQEIEIVTELTRRCIEDNSRKAQNQEEYRAKYDSLVKRYETAKTKVEELNKKKTEAESKAEAIEEFIKSLRRQEKIINEFDERLWLNVVENVTAETDGTLTFHFKSGRTVKA